MIQGRSAQFPEKNDKIRHTWGACLEDVFPFVMLVDLIRRNKLLETGTALR